MSRYIDADEAKKDADERGMEFFIDLTDVDEMKRFLDDQPTADVEEVVRCKNCKFRYSTTCFAKHETSENDFCSCGAKMDGEMK